MLDVRPFRRLGSKLLEFKTSPVPGFKRAVLRAVTARAKRPEPATSDLFRFNIRKGLALDRELPGFARGCFIDFAVESQPREHQVW